MKRFYLAMALLGVGFPGVAGAVGQPASFSRHVRPFLVRYCVECHNGNKLKAGLDLETYQSLMEGADSGPVLVAGKPDESKMVRMVEHKDDPFMPPKKSRQPKATEIGVLRAWIAAGAKNDAGKIKVRIPDIKPRGPVQAAVISLAYRPDGKLRAAGGKKEGSFIDSARGEVVGRLGGQAGKVTALAFSPDSKLLAVASGSPATSGQVRLYPVPGTGVPAGKPVHILEGHKDLIHEVVFSPDHSMLATCSYD